MHLLNLINNAILLKNVLVSLVVLLIIAALCTVIYILWNYAYPKLGWINHTSSNFDGYMEEYCNDVKLRLSRLIDAGEIKTEENPNADIDDIVFFIKFDFFHSNYPSTNWFFKRFFMNAEMHIVETGAPDAVQDRISNAEGFNEAKYFEYKKNVVDKLQIICDVLREKKKIIMAKKYSSENDLDVLVLDMMLNKYRPNLIHMYETRKNYGFNINFNIFRLYLTDIAHTIFKDKIKKIWTSFFDNVSSSGSAIIKWYDSLKARVESLPMVLAGISEGSRTNLNTTKDNIQYKKRIFENDDAELTEHFLFLFIPFIIPIVFISMFFKDAQKLIKNVFAIIGKLIESLSSPIKFIQILIGGLIGLLIVVAYNILKLIITILVYPIAFIIVAFISVLGTLVWFAVFLVILVAFFILWVLDMFTGGMVIRLLRCENHPDAWFQQSGYEKANRYVRTLACGTPCGKRYEPSSLFCWKHPNNRPSFCPQQYLFQLYKDGAIDDTHSRSIYARTLTSTFWSMTEEQKKEYLTTFLTQKQGYELACKSAFTDQTLLLRSICDTLDTSIKDKDIGETVQLFCRHLFCTHQDPDRYDYCKASVSKDVILEDDVVTMTLFKLVSIVAIISFVVGIVAMTNIHTFSK